MQEHVKWNTAKEVGYYLDLRIKNKPALMMEFYLVGELLTLPVLWKYESIFQLFFTVFSLSHQEQMLLVF
jgi:hypothetical protein